MMENQQDDIHQYVLLDCMRKQEVHTIIFSLHRSQVLCVHMTFQAGNFCQTRINIFHLFLLVYVYTVLICCLPSDNRI